MSEVKTDDTALESTEPQHPKYLVRQAKIVGMTDQQIKSLSTGELEDAVYEETIQLRARSNAERQFGIQLAASDRMASQPAPAPAPEAAEPEYDETFFDDDEYDARLRKNLKFGVSAAKRIRELEAKLQSLEQAHVSREAMAAGERLDEVFATLGEEWSDLLGTESAVELQGTRQLSKRNEILRRTGIDFTKGLPGTATLRAKIKAAAEELYGDLAKKPEPKKPEKSGPAAAGYSVGPDDDDDDDDLGKPSAAKEWSRSGTAKPTQRDRGIPAKGLEYARRKHVERTVLEGDSEGEDL